MNTQKIIALTFTFCLLIFSPTAFAQTTTYTLFSDYSNTQGPTWYYYYKTGSNNPVPAIFGTAQMLAKEWFDQKDNLYWNAGSSSWMWVDPDMNTGGNGEIATIYWKAPQKGSAEVTVTDKRIGYSGKGDGYTFGVGYVPSVGTWPASFLKTVTLPSTNLDLQSFTINQQMQGNGDALIYFKDQSPGDTNGDEAKYTISITFTPIQNTPTPTPTSSPTSTPTPTPTAQFHQVYLGSDGYFFVVNSLWQALITRLQSYGLPESWQGFSGATVENLGDVEIKAVKHYDFFDSRLKTSVADGSWPQSMLTIFNDLDSGVFGNLSILIFGPSLTQPSTTPTPTPTPAPPTSSITKQEISGNATLSSIKSQSTDTTDLIFHITGNLTISASQSSLLEKFFHLFTAFAAPDANSRVVFVDEDLNIDTNYCNSTTVGSNCTSSYPVDPLTGTVFVVKGNVNIDPTVTRIDAVIISYGNIFTTGNNCSFATNSSTNPQLVINGSLISLTLEKPIQFCRKLANNTDPAEKIVQQPKYLVILRDLMSDTLQKWSEIP